MARQANVTLSDALKVASIKTIEGYAKDWQKQKAGAEKLSTHLLKLAKEASTEANGDLAKAADIFNAAATYAQKHYQEGHQVDGKTLPIAMLLPYWPVAKSEILRAIRKEIDPKDHDTVAEVMKARKEAEAKAKEESGGDAEAGNTRARKVSVSQSTAEAMERLTAEVVRVDGHQELRPKLAELIDKAARSIGALVSSDAEESDDDVGAGRRAA